MKDDDTTTIPNYEELLLYWSGELESAERAAVEARLATDADARAYLAELGALESGVAEMWDVAPGRSFADAAVEAHGGKKVMAFPAGLRWLAVAAGIAVLAVAGIRWIGGTKVDETPRIVEGNPEISLPESERQLVKKKKPAPKLSSLLFASSRTSERLDEARARARKIRSTMNGRSVKL